MVNFNAVKNTVNTGMKLAVEKSKAAGSSIAGRPAYSTPIAKKIVIPAKHSKKLAELFNSIQDQSVKDYLLTELISEEKLTSKIMKKFTSFVESIDRATAKVPVEEGVCKSPEYANIRKYLEKHGKIDELKGADISENLEQEERFYLIKDFITRHTKDRMSDYLYENYYLKYLEQKVKAQEASTNAACLNSEIFSKDLDGARDTIENLREINRTYGTRIFLDENLNEASFEATNKIKDELFIWKHYSEGKAKLPKVLDYNRLKLKYFKEDCGGYASSIDGNIALRSISQPIAALRHELTHLNEGWLTNIIFVFSDMFREGVRLVEKSDNFMGHAVSKFRNSKFCRKLTHYDELKQAGVSDFYISYGKKNHSEAIAVAAQGDMQEYSNMFKFLLRLKGLPKFETKFPALKKEPNSLENFGDKLRESLKVNEEGIQVIDVGLFE